MTLEPDDRNRSTTRIEKIRKGRCISRSGTGECLCTNVDDSSCPELRLGVQSIQMVGRLRDYLMEHHGDMIDHGTDIIDLAQILIEESAMSAKATAEK